ncbi:hypothetical protein [Romboutsia sp.]
MNFFSKNITNGLIKRANKIAIKKGLRSLINPPILERSMEGESTIL